MVALDTETRPRPGVAFSGLDVRPYDGVYESTRSRVAGVSLAVGLLPTDSWYVPLQHDTGNIECAPEETFEEFRRLGDAIKSKKLLALFWNASFDHSMLAKLLGYPVWDHTMFVDGMILDKFARPRSNKHDLKSTVKQVFGHTMETFNAPSSEVQVPLIEDHPLVKKRPERGTDFGLRLPEDAAPYAEDDVRQTLRYITTVSKNPKLDRYTEICAIEHDWVTPVRSLNENQIGYDREAVKKLADEILQAREFCREVLQATGLENPASNPQTLRWLQTFGFKGLSTGKLALVGLETEPLKLAAKFLAEFRRTNVYINSYLSPAINADHPSELCGHFRGWGAISGRMTAGPCKGRGKNDVHVFASWLPHGQPRDNRFRNLYIARPGYSIVSADYAAQEYRTAAALAKAGSWIRTFNDPNPDHQDVHAATARGVYPDYDSVDDKTRAAYRNVGKTLNFSILYGAAAGRVADFLGISEGEAQVIIDKFFAAEPALLQFREKVIREAGANGLVHTFMGRPIAVVGSELTDGSEEDPPVHACLNYLIQGSCSEILRIAMLALFKGEAARIKIMGGDDSVRFVNSVHDEAVFEVRDELLEDFVPKIRSYMEGACPEQWPVRLPVDIKVGKCWSK